MVITPGTVSGYGTAYCINKSLPFGLQIICVIVWIRLSVCRAAEILFKRDVTVKILETSVWVFLVLCEMPYSEADHLEARGRQPRGDSTARLQALVSYKSYLCVCFIKFNKVLIVHDHNKFDTIALQ